MVVISAGIRANTELAREAGLKVERGIVVDDGLNCPDDPRIFAVGECAQHRDQVYGLVAPLFEQTAVLADRLSGRNPQASYPGSKVSTKLKVMGVELAVMGDKHPREPGDEEVSYVERSRGIYKKLIIRNGQLAGAILLGDSLRAASLHQYFDQGSELPENRAELLFPMSGEAKPLTMAYVPDSAQICNCNGVSKGRLVQAIQVWLPQPQVAVRCDSRWNGLRFLQAAGAGDSGDGFGWPDGGRSRGALLRPGSPADQIGADSSDQNTGFAKRLGGVWSFG